jgi:hypothetical protein
MVKAILKRERVHLVATLRDVLLGPARLYETLREKPRTAPVPRIVPSDTV